MASRLTSESAVFALLDQASAAELYLAGDGHGGLTVTGKKRDATLVAQLLDSKEAVLEVLDAWEAVEERAAIMEYDGGLPRAEAEQQAWVALGVNDQDAAPVVPVVDISLPRAPVAL